MSEQKYFYIDNGAQTGPVTVEELLGRISPNTDIWCPGMDNWAPACKVPEVAALIGGGVPGPAASGMPDPAATPYTGGNGDYSAGNSQNYGSNPNYADPQPNFGEPQGNYVPQTSPNLDNNQNFGNQNFGSQQNVPMGDKPDTYLVWAILSTILCCSVLSLPFGIISIVNASKVDSEWYKGNYEAAKKASENAKNFAIITAVVGFVLNIIIALLSR